MACINSDGTLSKSAMGLLRALTETLTQEKISQQLGEPMFKVRLSLREMVNAGFITETDGNYQLTAKGKALL